MIVTYVCINIAWLFIGHYFVWKEIGLSLIVALKDIFPFLFIAAFVMLLTYYITLSISNICMIFIGKIIVAVLLYILIMWLSRSVTFKECIQYLLRK